MRSFQDQERDLNAFAVGAFTGPLQGVTSGTSWLASALGRVDPKALQSGTRHISTFGSNREPTIAFACKRRDGRRCQEAPRSR